MFIPRLSKMVQVRSFFCREAKLDPTDYYNNRKTSLLHVDAYPHDFRVSTSVQEYLAKYKGVNTANSHKENVAGRITSIRRHGKLSFVDIKQDHHKVQVVVQKMDQNIKRGDIIGVKGEPFVTQKGELSVKSDSVHLLAPCFHMLPEEDNLKDVEQRYRKRYLDLIVNKHSLDKLRTRSKVIHFLRNYLTSRGFLQVQTPCLSSTAGGAIAKPFQTYLHELDLNLYLRIAPQLYLKQLLVGGVPKVFELGKNFRNEGMDPTHNPEFTSLELYQTYKNYQDMMDMTEDLMAQVVKQITGSFQTQINGVTVNFSKKWLRVQFVQGLEEATNRKFPTQFESKQALQFLDNVCKEFSVECSSPRTPARMLDKLSGQFLESSQSPLFITKYPSVMSPLAKTCPGSPHLSERFQGFVNNWEIVNSYTQLNDPEVQLRNTPTDKQFVECLEYGLPPCAGWGLGVDRLVMLLTDSSTIQQVITFPLMKPILPS